MYRNLKQQYADYMEEKIKKYADDNGLKVLVSNFIDSYYMAVFQNIKQNKQYILMIENIKQPIIIELNAYISPDDYHVCHLYQLTNHLPNEYLQRLISRGLYQRPNPQRKNTSYFAIHRLVCCIGYENINGITINHNNKDKADNRLDNLTPMSLDVNIFLDTLDYNHMILASKMFKDISNEEIKKKRNKKRNTVASNGNLHKEIIEYKQQHKIKEVVSKFKSYISTPQTIRDILHYYFYGEEFLSVLS